MISKPQVPSNHVSPLTSRPRALTHLGVLAIFTLVTIIATWPMFPQLGGYVIDKGDPLYSVWAMAWQGRAIVTDPLRLFDTNVMFPFKGTLAFDELSFSEAMLAAPFYWLSGNPVLSHNIVLFATFPLCGYAVWLLVRELTGGVLQQWSGLAGMVAGMAFAFSFYRLNHLPHMTLISTQWLPLVLLAAYKALWTHKWKWAWALAVFFTLQALSGHYLAFYTAMLLGFFFFFYLLVQRRLFSWAVIGKVVAALALSLVVMLPVLVPYVLLQSGQQFKRDIFETERFSNTLSSFLAVFRGNTIYRKLLAPFGDPGFWAIERAAFPGLAVVILAVMGCIFAWRGHSTNKTISSFNLRFLNSGASSGAVSNQDQSALHKTRQSPIRVHAAFYAIVALASAVLSLGPGLQITYASSNYDPNAIQRVMPLPYLLLYEWVPGFQSMRVVGRIGVLTALALSILAGFGAAFVLRSVAARLKVKKAFALTLVAAVLSLLPVIESWSAPISMAAVGTRDAVPALYRWLAVQPQTVIVEYPMVSYKRGDVNVEMENLYQYYSTYHWQYTVNGSTSIRPFSYSALALETEKCFPCPRSLDALWALGVRYVAVHLENLSDPQRTDFLWRSTNPAGRVVESFRPVQDFGEDRVYRLEPREVGQLTKEIPVGEPVLLADPGDDPERQVGALVYGGYLATLGYMLRDHPQVSADPRVSYSQPVGRPDPANLPRYALLWADQDPTKLGYNPAGRLWSNEFVALYVRATPGGENTP